MQQLKCASCGAINGVGATTCSNCGLALQAAAFAVPTRDVPAAVIVDRGMSDQAKIVTALLGIVGAVVIGLLFYQWGQWHQSQTDLDRASAERTNRTIDNTAPATSQTAPAPVIVTTPAPSIVTTTSPSESDPTAQRDLSAYVSSMEPLLKSWREGIRIAETAQGTQLATAISNLADVERRAELVSPPSAAADAHNRMIRAMRTMVDELTTASQQQTAIAQSTSYLQARNDFELATTEYDALRRG